MEGNDIFGMHKHHIVFRSQGGLDFALNLIELTQEEHEGDDGPHKNRVRDLELKKRLQNQLVELFPEGGSFNLNQISVALGRTRRYFEKHFRKVPCQWIDGEAFYESEDIIRMLMGGKIY